MTPEQEILKQQIIKKIEAGEDLTDSEEYFYLTQVMGHTPQEAETIITIADNQDKNVLID